MIQITNENDEPDMLASLKAASLLIGVSFPKHGFEQHLKDLKNGQEKTPIKTEKYIYGDMQRQPHRFKIHLTATFMLTNEWSFDYFELEISTFTKKEITEYIESLTS